MDRRQRLTNLLRFINENGHYEYNFQKLYQMLIEEYRMESLQNSKMQENRYLNNLRQTRDKQADDYLRAKRKKPKSSCYAEFKAFVSHFKQDVNEELYLTVNPKPDQNGN